MPPPKKSGSVGPFFGIIIVIGMLLVGAFYFWGGRLNNQAHTPPPYIPSDISTTTP